jgi:hypothetical protein
MPHGQKRTRTKENSVQLILLCHVRISSVRPELVEGHLVLRQAQHERDENACYDET